MSGGRRLRWHRQRGMARGVAVMSGGDGPPDAEQLRALLAACERLRAYGRSHGLELQDNPASLVQLDERLDGRIRDPEIASWLASEAAMYLGTVIVRHVPGASWRPRPNGQPVVLLGNGREIDVVSVTSKRIDQGGLSLHAILEEARQSR